MTKSFLGVDFGGTFVKMGIVDDEGKIVARASFPTEGLNGVEGWLDAVGATAAGMGYAPETWGKRLAGAGVGVPGFVDFARGYIHDLTNVPGWTAVSLAERMTRRFGVRTFVDNDANAMALGECRFGAGRHYHYAVFVTLGTGVGGGLVLDGKLYRGAHSMAGEIGHISIDRNGVTSPQGRGGLEQYVGNRRIVEHTVRLLQAGRTSIIPDLVGGDLKQITPKVVLDAAEKGDALGLEIYDYVADCLATAFSSLTYILQPEVFIIGGGVAGAGDILFVPLRTHLAARLSPHFSKLVEVRAAALGNDAGLIGAAALAME